ncbi:MAG: hypothetical protein Q9181_007573 [Wetmoreana brouardii]
MDARRTDFLSRDRSFSNPAHGTPLPTIAQTDLEAAALAVIKLMQTIEDGKYKDKEVLVVGGQAIQHWYPGFREPPDYDLKVLSERPTVKSIEEAIASNSGGRYKDILGPSCYKLDNGVEAIIDLLDSKQYTDKAGGYKPASEINSAADLPYISKSDLLFSKLISCNERRTNVDAEKDARDAVHVVIKEKNQGGISLTREQKDAINRTQCMPRVIEITRTTNEWWDTNLGLEA